VPVGAGSREHHDRNHPSVPSCAPEPPAHTAVGRAHRHQPITLLVAGRHARVVAEDGPQNSAQRTLDPARDREMREPGAGVISACVASVGPSGHAAEPQASVRVAVSARLLEQSVVVAI